MILIYSQCQKHSFDKINLYDLDLIINTLGSSDDRKKNTLKKLIEYFEKYNDSFTDQQKLTFKKNPLRLLDSKDDKLKDIIETAPKINEYINKESLHKFENIIKNLII